MKVVFNGYSDDFFECECRDKNVYFDEYKTYILRDELRQEYLVVSGFYTHFDGTWHIAIGQRYEDIPIPNWTMVWTSKGYTTILEIDVPENVIIEPAYDNEIYIIGGND